MKGKDNYVQKYSRIIIMAAVFCVVAVFILIQGIFFLNPGDAMGYSLLDFYLILPITAFVCSIIAGKEETPLKWILPILFGIIGFLLPGIVFQSYDMVAVFFALLPSIVGTLIGTGFQYRKRKKNSRKDAPYVQKL